MNDYRSIRKLPLQALQLDPENPRLASLLSETSDRDELVHVLWREMAVDEVALSIAENGFYEDEPLLVVPQVGVEPESITPDGSFIVVEGNRRLAAVLLLIDDELRKKIRATDLPQLSTPEKEALHYLPVSVWPDRKSIWAYLGFRHINGTKPWDAFSKAKYVADVHEEFGISLDEIARRIGDRHATVRRLYRGLIVLRQAEQQTAFDKEDRVSRRFSFSHLYTALELPEYQEFLGITPERWETGEPVPGERLEELGELMTWLYGRKSTNTPPVIRTQAPDLHTLRRVISNTAALSALRAGYGLERSHEISEGDHRRFREAIVSAKEDLQVAKGTVATGYNGERELWELMDDVVTVTGSIQREMEGIRAQARSKS